MTSAMVDQITGLQSAVAVKGPVRVATTANISLIGLQTIDGVALAESDRVLVKNQTDQTKNGIYTASALAWSRAGDLDESTDVVKGTRVNATDGATNSGDWQVTSANPFVLDTNNLTWATYLPATVAANVAAAAASASTASGAASAASASAAAAAASAGSITTVDVQIHAATAKSPIIGADELGFWDSVSTALRKITFTNFVNSLGVPVAALTAKATPVDADGVLITDSAASGVSKFASFTNMWANYFKAKADALYQAKTALLTAFVGLANASGVLTNDGAGNLSWAAASGSNTQTFNASGTWTKPAGSYTVAFIQVWGSGGGASGGSASGGGGGGGGYTQLFVPFASLGATEAVTINAGGAGVINGAAGSPAANSFGAWAIAPSGGGANNTSGGGGGIGKDGTGGAGGAGGGSGANGGNSSGINAAGGGGGAAASGGPWAGGVSISTFGTGLGGPGGQASTGAGNAGTAPGGGGGGRNNTAVGGAGALGRVIVTCY